MTPRRCDIKMPLRVLATALLLLLLVPLCSSGLQIDPSDASGAWTVRAGDALDDRALRSIVSSTFAEVYVLYTGSSDASALATIRCRGGESDYTPTTGSSGFSSPSPRELRIANGAYVETVEITVHDRAQLHHVQAAGYGSVVVDHDVIVSNDAQANVTAIASSTGSVYLPPQMRLRVAVLSLQSRSYGSVRLVARGITVDSLDVQVLSGGTVKLHADSITAQGTVSVRDAGYGDASLATGTLHAARLDVAATSSGDALVTVSSGASTVAQCHYTLSSMGDVEAGTVGCMNATVENTGNSDAIVQVSDSLVYSSTGFGHVYYTGTRPKTITSSSTRQNHAVQAATEFSEDRADASWADSYTLPPHERLDPFAQDRPEDAEREVSDSDDSADTPAASAPHEFPWLFVGVAASILAVLVLKRAYRAHGQRGRRNEKARLLDDDAPVYI